MKHKAKQPAGTERARDEQRDSKAARYGGGPWQVADERGDQRFGQARNDDAEIAARDADHDDDDESPGVADPEIAAAEAAGEIVGSGEITGMGRGDKPRKARGSEKPRSRKTKKTTHAKRGK